MQRNMDLIRELLLRIESKENLTPETIVLDGYDQLVVERHLELMFKAGLIDGYRHEGLEEGDPDIIDVRDLSWAGHELLGSVREPESWRTVKSILTKSGRWTVTSMAKTAEALLIARIKEVSGLDL